MSAAAITSIIERLLEAGTPFRIVEGATEFAGIEKNSPVVQPAAFVVIKEEAGAENERATGGHLQRIEADVAIVLYFENVSDDVGGAAGGGLEGLKSFIRSKLAGWEPAGAAEPMEFISGELLHARDGAVWHEDVYSLITYLEVS